MTAELDETLRKHDQQVRIREWFESMGCSEEQCDIAVRSFAHDEKILKWTGGALMWVQPGGIVT